MKRHLVPFVTTAVVCGAVVAATSVVLVLGAARRAPAIDLEVDRETNTQRLLADHLALLAQHGSEARDSKWVPNQEQHLRAALGALSDSMKHSFSVQSVDCRTGSCVAQLTWPSETAARLEADTFTRRSAAARCSPAIAFPPADGAGPYTASLYLDCAEPP